MNVITLDDYCRSAGIDRVDVLKTDTQGYDLEVLKGAERLFQDRRISVVHVEVTFDDLYEGMPEFDELYRFLADRQMRLVALYNYVMRSGVAGWCDALFALPKQPIAEPPRLPTRRRRTDRPLITDGGDGFVSPARRASYLAARAPTGPGVANRVARSSLITRSSQTGSPWSSIVSPIKSRSDS